MPQSRQTKPGFWPGLVMCLCCCGVSVSAGEHHGLVKFDGRPLPGASVTLTQSARVLHAITDLHGAYRFNAVESGPFAVTVEMQLFQPLKRDFSETPMGVTEWVLEVLPEDQIRTLAKRQSSGAARTAFQRTEGKAVPPPVAAEVPRSGAGPTSDTTAAADLAQQAADGFLINGSVNNGAASPFSQMPAFGNNRRGQRSLYNGNLGVVLNNSVFDARAYSLTGQNTPKPQYNRIQGLFAFGGPLRIPGLLRRNGPNITLNHQWTRNSNATTQSGLVPTPAERVGSLADSVTDPVTGLPFPGNAIPANRISPQASALLQLYPVPNFRGSGNYNFQVPLVSGFHQDDLQTRGNKQVGRNFYSMTFSWQSTRTDTPSLFGFLDTGSVNGITATASYRRVFSPRTFLNGSVNYNRLVTRVSPYFADRENISGIAGITGNNQEPANWGPPNLGFASGITPLNLGQASLVRNQTAGISVDLFASRASHNLSAGITLRRQQFNILSQQDARGTFGFTGAATGNDFGGFLLGLPDTSSIAFGNADKYLRGRIYETFINDDWRVNPGLTINFGLRWEYWSPVEEKYGRLVNLDVTEGFRSATASRNLPPPDRNNFAPRVAFSWRPLVASSLVIRGGYGLYYDTSIYQPIALEMAQQAPLSKSMRASNSPETPLSLANGFPITSATDAPVFGADQNFRVGYAHLWQLSVQRDLPAAMQVSATYSGGRGSRAQQRVLPNTFPTGATMPSGFAYLTAGGNSIRHSGQFLVRRRMRSGFTAQLKYTWAKSLDDAMLGGRGQPFIAQNWLDLQAERGRSSFDQRHLANASIQYTSGMGLRGGALSRGWGATLVKDWTVGSQLTLGSGLPLTPIYPVAVPGTGFTGTIRPDYTGAPLYDAPPGLALNPAAYASPAPGSWGNAGRNTITGPGQFTLGASLGRTFRSTDRVSADLRIDAQNLTNTPTFASWNTVAGSAIFGLPDAANPMRTIQVTIRMRF